MFTNGEMFESIFTSWLRSCGYDIDFVNGWHTPKKIEAVFAKHHLPALTAARRGQELDHESGMGMTKSRLIDLLGLDNIIQDQGKVLGFDITCNPDKVQQKLQKLQRCANGWKQLGVHAVAVVLIECDHRNEYNIPGFSEIPIDLQEAIETKLYDLVDEMKAHGWAFPHILTVCYPGTAKL